MQSCMNPTCDNKTKASGGYCLDCKYARLRGFKRVRAEGLLLDEAGGAWWIWDRIGNVLVIGRPTMSAAAIALGHGDIESAYGVL